MSFPYVLRKAKLFPGRTILVREGDMIRSFRARSNSHTLTIDNTDWKFRFHELGKGVPQRRMMRLDTQRATRVTEHLESDLEEQLQKKGLL